MEERAVTFQEIVAAELLSPRPKHLLELQILGRSREIPDAIENQQNG